MDFFLKKKTVKWVWVHKIKYIGTYRCIYEENDEIYDPFKLVE